MPLRRRSALRVLSILMGLAVCGAAAVSAAAANPPASGATPNAATGADLCAGSVSDKNAHPMTAMPKPAKGVPFKEPEFNSRIIRITDVKADTGRAGVRAPMYSTIPAWNADESYLIVYQTQGYVNSGVASKWQLYDGKSYRYIKDLPIGPADVEDVYWSASEPQVLFYISDYGYPNGNFDPVLVKYNVGSDSHTVLHHFQNLPVSPQKVDFGHILYMSWDNTLIGIREQNGNKGIFSQSYRLSTGAEGGWKPYKDGQDYQGLQIAPSGTTAIIGSKVVDPVSQSLLRRMKTDTEEHGALGRLANGDDAWISSQYGSNEFPNPANYGNILVENLQTGVVTPIVAPATGWLAYPAVTSHISTSAFKAPGWVANSIVGDVAGQKLLDEEILLANINTGVVCRVAHHHSNGSDDNHGPQGYWAEPHVVISPSGTRMLFGSDWGGTDSVDAYVVELPTYSP